MKREDCWMTFSEALEEYLTAREQMNDAPKGCDRWYRAEEKMRVAAKHMDALTGDKK